MSSQKQDPDPITILTVLLGLWIRTLQAVDAAHVPSKRVMSSPFLHKTISFSESCVGDLMLYVATKFNNKMYQMLVWPFLAFANI
jgi:hypothetical protein